ncbi:hypothetical protein Tco_0599919 [Tanacetum coccineum]
MVLVIIDSCLKAICYADPVIASCLKAICYAGPVMVSQATLAGNVMGPISLTRLQLPRMLKRCKGHFFMGYQERVRWKYENRNAVVVAMQQPMPITSLTSAFANALPEQQRTMLGMMLGLKDFKIFLELLLLRYDTITSCCQRHPWLRYQIQEYTEGIKHSYEQRLKTIWSRPVNQVYVLDFEGLTLEMRQDLAVRLRMVYSGEGMRDTEMGLDVENTLCFQLGGVRRRMTGQAHEKVTGIDLFYLRSMDRGTTNVPHLLAQYLFRHTEGKKSRARMSGGHFIRHLAMHFGLLGRLNICTRYDDTWAWVAHGPERQHGAAAGAYEADEAGLAAEEGAQEIPVPVPAPTPAQLMDASGQTYQPFDSTLVGSSWLSFQMCVRPRTGDASTSAAPHTDAQPDP